MDSLTPILTDQEKKYLGSYNEQNPFLKSLSDFYKERAMLSEKQILALRKEQKNDTNKFSRCPNTGLNKGQTCLFVDISYKENKNVIVNAIRERAICISDEENNTYSWMPSSAINLETRVDTETGEEIYTITLKSWFTRDDDFWKQSKPFVPNTKKEVEKIDEESPYTFETDKEVEDIEEKERQEIIGDLSNEEGNNK
jgi:hypothetical protein